jgi:hypothetical protein
MRPWIRCSFQASIFQYAAEVQKHDLSIAEAGELNDILHSVRYAVSAAKSVKDILHDLDVIDESEEVPASQMREKFNQVAKSYLKQVDHVLSHPDAFDLAETIYTGREAFYRIENEHILQITGILKAGICKIPSYQDFCQPTGISAQQEENYSCQQKI